MKYNYLKYFYSIDRHCSELQALCISCWFLAKTFFSYLIFSFSKITLTIDPFLALCSIPVSSMLLAPDAIIMVEALLVLASLSSLLSRSGVDRMANWRRRGGRLGSLEIRNSCKKGLTNTENLT